MRLINLCVLVDEGPIARAYLAAMKACEIRPRKIVVMVRSRHPSTGQQVLGFLSPLPIRLPLVRWYQQQIIHYWPKTLKRDYAMIVDRIKIAVTENFGFDAEVFDATSTVVPYSEYGDNVEEVFADDLSDPRIQRPILSSDVETVLFTGGGIVGDNLLKLEGIRLIHVHPAPLPHVRGADGVLWSLLTKGYCGASCFEMEHGLDTGGVALVSKHENVAIPLPEGERPDDKTLYRMLFAFLDPFIRAYTLIQILDRWKDPSSFVFTPQDKNTGTTFHFMHESLRREALSILFPEQT